MSAQVPEGLHLSELSPGSATKRVDENHGSSLSATTEPVLCLLYQGHLDLSKVCAHRSGGAASQTSKMAQVVSTGTLPNP